MIPTPVSSITLDGREFLIKRDDLIDLYLAGNKYRKLHTLIKTPNDRYKRVVSYGGTQSNAMLAIAKMCHDKGWEFVYYTKSLSQAQRKYSTGNFASAKELGMRHIEIEHALYKEFIASLSLQNDSQTLLLHQGGADLMAQAGIKSLAKEIQEQNPNTKVLATPSGTGTTALFLALALPEYTLYTTPLIGDVKYLKTQMKALRPLPANLVILDPGRKYPFAKPDPEFYTIYKKLLESGIEFDLLYAPLMWKMLLEKTDEKVLYIHSGGVSGNKSMLARYKQLGIVT